MLDSVRKIALVLIFLGVALGVPVLLYLGAQQGLTHGSIQGLDGLAIGGLRNSSHRIE